MKNFHRFLQITPAKRLESFYFNLLNFRFFKNSEDGNILFRGTPRLLSLLTVIPYILAMEVILFRGKCYFVKLKEQMVGIFVIREKPQTLYINSLAVAPEYRRLRIATHMLNYANKLANRMAKRWLELSVSKANILALRLYKKLGFTKKKEKKWSFILRKNVQNH